MISFDRFQSIKKTPSFCYINDIFHSIYRLKDSSTSSSINVGTEWDVLVYDDNSLHCW